MREAEFAVELNVFISAASHLVRDPPAHHRQRLVDDFLIAQCFNAKRKRLNYRLSAILIAHPGPVSPQVTAGN
ncbi:MAG: hypothetical protein H0T78_08740 [Longispora sp.]|nr:hypothetical protein [Longispora sp. (in: high G+C Gram-positive bacteria)]